MKFRELIAYDEEEKDEWDISDRVFTLAVFAAWVVILNLLAVIYISRSEYIYFWDSATYWDISERIAGGALLPDFLKSVYNSISNSDYNCLAGLPTALTMKLFGGSRLVYVLSLVNLYLVPTMAMIYHLAKKSGKAPLFTLSVTMLICPAAVFMAFAGFADVGGLPAALLCFCLYFDSGMKKRGQAAVRSVLIGAILVLLMLWRRWYAFFAVSFITAMAADCIINRKNIMPAIIAAAFSGACLFFCFRDFTFNILLRDYQSIYSGYKFSPLTDLKLITRYFGFIYILLLAAATVYGAVKKRDLSPVFMWVQMIVCAVMFMFLQTHGQQHLLLYIPSLMVLTVYMISVIDKNAVAAAICVFAAVSAVNVYMPYKQPQNIQEIKYFSPIPSFSLRPRVMKNARFAAKLKGRLDAVVAPGETLGVLASSFEMNEDILRNAYPSMGLKQTREDYIVTLPQVDLRDTDVSVYGRVNYVLVVNPPQTHLAEGSQKILTEALNSFNAWTDIAAAYEEVYDFASYEDDMEIKLFRRVRDVSEGAFKELEARCAAG